MSDFPKVSIQIPVYNAAKYLSEMLESVIHQSYSDIEIRIIDDNSNDDSWEILQKYATIDNRIVLSKNEINKGVSFTRNRMISETKAEYIAFMDADDIMPIDRIHCQTMFLDENKDCHVVFGGVEIVDSEGRFIERESFGKLNKEDVEAKMFFSNVIPNGGTMFRRKFVIENEIGFDENATVIVDYDFWARCISHKANIQCIDTITEKWRINPSGLTQSTKVKCIEKRVFRLSIVHRELLEYYGVRFTKQEEKTFLRFANKEIGMGRKEKIKNYFSFYRMMNRLKRSDVILLGNSFMKECENFENHYYGKGWLLDKMNRSQ